MDKLTVLKIGGNIIDNTEMLNPFLDDFARLPGKKILVHGGGKTATGIAASLGIEARFVEGRRITDRPMLEVVTMVYGGSVNKRMVAALQARGCNAIGLTGADANIIEAKKREAGKLDYGFAGDIVRVNAQALEDFLTAGLTPVLAPLTHDRQGNLLNTNADTLASAVASALAGNRDVDLLYCFEKSGVLLSAEEETTALPVLSFQRYMELREEETVTGGMLPKLETAFQALQAGVNSVRICRASDAFRILQQGSHLGTRLEI